MSMTKGDIIKTTDLLEAMKTYVTSLLTDANEGKVGYATFGTKKALWDAFNSEYSRGVTESANYKVGRVIKISDVRRIMIYAMQESCRLGTITYKLYRNVGNVNVSGYRPPTNTYSYYGVFTTTSKSDAEYAAAFPESSFPAPNTVIRAIDIKNILAAMVAYNKTNVHETKNLGYKNTCYTSCHSSCHGSSRSRR